MDDRDRVCEALYELFTTSTTWYCLSQKHYISVMTLRRAYAAWMKNPPESQLLSPRDVKFFQRSPGRPFLLPHHHVCKIAEAVQYYADNNTPLTRPGVRELMQIYVSLLSKDEREKINIGDNGPSDKCLNNMMEKFGLKYMSSQVVEDQRLDAITPETVSEHIARVQAAIDRYHIREARYIFNTDQSGSSFKRMCGRSLRKGYGKKDAKVQQACVKTKGQLNRVTVMPCVSAAGKALKPVFVFPGKHAHYRKVGGVVQILHSVLQDCYLHYREVPGADSAIIYDWAVNFVTEAESLRKDGQYLLMGLDGYSAHMQFRTLAMLRRNRVIVIALPAHSSHRLQALDVSVFSSYKSYLEKLMHRAAHVRKRLNPFDIVSIIAMAYSESMSNIRSGFTQCGIWDHERLGTNIETLKHLFVSDISREERSISVDDLVAEFNKRARSLLRDADVEEADTIRIKTTKGAHLTSEAVLSALEKRESNRTKKDRTDANVWMADVREAKDVRRLAELADRRHDQRKRLGESRVHRRVRQKLRMESGMVV